jgi:hypothetical protein
MHSLTFNPSHTAGGKGEVLGVVGGGLGGWDWGGGGWGEGERECV